MNLHVTHRKSEQAVSEQKLLPSRTKIDLDKGWKGEGGGGAGEEHGKCKRIRTKSARRENFIYGKN